MTLLPMENRESILHALKCFGKDKPSNIPPILEDYIKQVAGNGRTMLPWIHIKPLILHKFNKVVDSLIAESNSTEYTHITEGVHDLRQRVFDSLRSLNGIPFTIQRICELLETPFRHYSRPDKFLRGFEKVCLVVSTVDPQGNKILHEDPRFPSRAGLEGCDTVLTEGLSPPPSPLMDDLHRPQTSKSSDDEMTEDDDNEDEFENHAESSSSTSPSDSVPMSHCSTSSDNPSPNAWPFGVKDVVSSKPQEGQIDVGGSTSNALLSPKTQQMFDAESPSTSNAMHEDAENRQSVSDSKVSEASELVPPIVQILRPIGQLEAFVQNMGADIPSLPSCLLSPVTNEVTSTVLHDSDEEDSSSAAGASLDVSPPVAGVRGKRRSMSPIPGETQLSDGSDSSEVVQESAAQRNCEQSPAKRRRLSESLLDTSGTDSQCPLPEAVAVALNDSPPIIICNPDVHSRNHETVEAANDLSKPNFSSNEPGDEMDTTPDIADQSNPDAVQQSSSSGEEN